MAVGYSGVKTGKRSRVMFRALPLLIAASAVTLPRALERMAERDGERRGYRVKQFKLTARDGTRLSAMLYVPRGEGPFPALVMVHSWMFSRWQCHLYAPYFASEGYVVLSYDCRGWGSSGGEVTCADPQREINDLVDAVDWLLEESGVPVKEGALGVTGISYGGGHSFLIAARDPRVRTVVPMCGWTDLEASLAPQGSVKIVWGTFLVITASWATRLNPANILYRWMLSLLSRRNLDRFREDMRARSVLHLAETVDRPMLIVASWNDDLFEPNQQMEFYRRLPGPKMLYMSNGIHGIDPGVGPRWTGREIWELTRRWFDYWLKGEENGILSEPPVRLYRPWDGTYSLEEDWPPPGLETAEFRLRQKDGRLLLSPGGGTERAVVKIPGIPVSAVSSGLPVLRLPALGIPVLGPEREKGLGYVSFTGPPLDGPRELLGAPRLELVVRPLSERLQLNGFLYDVPPAGRPRLITHGTITLEGEAGRERPAVMEMVAAYHLLRTGHRLRLALSCSDPLYVLPVRAKGGEITTGDPRARLLVPWRKGAES